MSQRYKGAIISATPPTTSTSSASGEWTLAQQMQAQGASAWPVANPDPYFNQVSLLLHGDGTNGGQNNTFLDSSTNNFTITRVGNVAQGTFSPFSLAEGQWSNYFNSSNIRFPYSTNLDISSGDFTVEFWVNAPAQTAGGNAVRAVAYFNGGPAGVTSVGWVFNFQTNGAINFQWCYGGSFFFLTSATTALNSTWNHVAVTKSGSLFTLWLNGVSQQTNTLATSSNTNAAWGVYVGSVAATNTTNIVNSYISNLRIVKGTAVYTSNFTPPTAPLTAITNTSLLTCQSNRFIDNSANNSTYTLTSTPSTNVFSPFIPTAAYSASTNGGSGYFDGSGDYLSAPDSTSLQVLGSAFTIECWFYLTSTSPADMSLISKYDAGGAGYILRLLSTGTGIRWYAGTGGQVLMDRTYAFALNTWYHVAVTCDGTNTAIFVNGVKQGASGGVSSNNSNATFQVGLTHSVTNYFPGYISNVRVVKGTDVYGVNNSSFTIPTAPLTAITNTQLLLNCTNAGIYDNAIKNDIETVGNAQISTSVKKYGTGSMYFDGTGDWLSIPASNNFYFGTGDFTVEFWLNTSSGNQAIVDQWLNGSGNFITGQWQIGMDISTRYLNFYVATSTNVYSTFSTSSAPASGQWVHIACVRSSNVIKFYINGTANANTLSFSGVVGVANSKASIGVQTNNSTLPFLGYIDDLRITNGVARYTADFVPPIQAFPDY